MKTVVIVLTGAVMLFCENKKKLTVKPAATHLGDTVDFKKQIQPILQTRCTPCHFPGGKMYEKLPFDTASTIIEQREGILKRIKDEKENMLIRQFIEHSSQKREDQQ